MTDLRTRAEEKGAELSRRGFKVIRADGELLTNSKGANDILGRGPRYLESLRYSGWAPRSVQFTHGPSAHHWYRITELLGMVSIQNAA